jgi:hypothetical protein
MSGVNWETEAATELRPSRRSLFQEKCSSPQQAVRRLFCMFASLLWLQQPLEQARGVVQLAASPLRAAS